MNVLTISTLSHKGGAAYIGRVLHNGLKEKGINTKFLVGYGAKGLKDKSANEDFIYSKYLLSQYLPALNLVVHNLIGKDIFSPSKHQLKELFNWSDVIICHTLHSYFINFELLFKLFKELNGEKRIILVAHDSWHYTGRCAFVFDCENWKNSCVKCPNRDFYPKSFFSISNNEYRKKIALLSSIKNLSFVSPANWICNDLRFTYPNSNTFLIRNSVEVSYYHDFNRIYKEKSFVEVCVSCVDINQPGKIDLKFVKELLDLGIKVHFIGKNNPLANHDNAINHGYIVDKKKYIAILSKVDCYLFTSSIDIYPTVLVDAICAGMYIIYTESKGAQEVMEGENNWLSKKVNNAHQVAELIRFNKGFNSDISNFKLREEKRKEALEFYNKNRMVNEYLKLF